MAFLLKKSNHYQIVTNTSEIEEEKGIKEGIWDSIHVASVSLEGKTAKYRVASTVFLKMGSNNPIYGDLEIAGTLSKSVI